MRGLIVKSRPVYELVWDAEMWDLYTDMDGVEDVARDLSEAFSELASTLSDRNEVRRRMERKMNDFRSFGADDTEPRYALEDLLDAVFGVEG